MDTRVILSGAAAIMFAGALSSAQITPQGGIQQRPPQPTTQQPRAKAQAGTVTTLTGCLYQEDSVPGRTPNFAEKAGVQEDFILADAAPSREQNRLPDRPIAEAGQPDQRPDPPAEGLATGRMYKVTSIDDDRLKDLVGKRVEVTGSIKVDDDVRPGEKPANFKDLPNIDATSIRQLAGPECPTSPAPVR
jgi:hypothetical protein